VSWRLNEFEIRGWVGSRAGLGAAEKKKEILRTLLSSGI
jgi:hypothetical protein